MATPAEVNIFCLDQSEAAFGSEDFPGSRWQYQVDIVEALAERLYLQQAACQDRAHLTGLHCTSGKQRSLCHLSSSSAKTLSPPTPIAGRAAALAALHSLLPCCAPSSNTVSALKLAVLVASGADSASITAFIAGPCSIASADIPGLASALAKRQVTIVSLASAAELGKDSVAALQSLIASLNASPGASASKLVFLDPPPESLEHWQQLERALELLERQDTQHRRATLPAPGSDQFAPQTPDRQDNQDASSAPARSAAREGQLASQVAVSESSRGVQQRSGHSQRGREALVWHMNRPLLARRSGVFQSAICRSESLDVLGHLSSDGCMRPWLPSYANLPKAATEPPVYLSHQLCLPSGPKWRVLLDIPAGMMRKVRSHAPAPGGPASSARSAPGSRPDEKLPNHIEPCMREHGRQHTARSRGQGASVTTVQLPELSLDGTAPSGDQAGAHCAPLSGSGPHTWPRRSRGSAQPRRVKPCTARHPLRLEADSRSGRLLLVETRDSRKLLRLIWCPAKHNASSVTAAPSRSHVLRQSIWERPRPSEESCPPEGMLMKLPEQELKMALDPAAVSFSAAHAGQVLVVEQAVAREGHVSQSPKYKGVFRNLAADEQPVDRCFFWLQDAGACAPSTQRAERGAPLETVAEEAASAGDAAASVETSSSAAVTAPDGSMQPEGRTQPRMTAEAAALALRRLVQSAVSRAQRTGHSSPAFPLLQISGSFQVSFEPRGVGTQVGSAAWGRPQEGCPASDQPSTQLRGSLKVTLGQQEGAPLEHCGEQCTQSGACAALDCNHAEHESASRNASCGKQSIQRSSNKSFPGQVDIVAASAEAGTEAGQECFEDSALYELD
ncbi:g4463 [Coccomyxa viridis]|uniref:G4463 protein n=1 Tax=Coccomyxa viridis TaxID=1274662 RepID=A0ABP1FVL6_9CHLO